MYESRAIGHYIATKYADQGTPGLIPTEVKAFGRFQQACSIEIWNFHEFAGKAHFEKAVKPFLGLQSDMTVYDNHIASVDKSLDVYEKILSKQKYLAGDVRNEISFSYPWFDTLADSDASRSLPYSWWYGDSGGRL